jgi:peptide deformylase
MPLLAILEFPDPRLRTHAKPVGQVDASIGALIDDMFETMYEAPGIGLAATQINVHQQIVVIDISEDNSDPLVLINPSYDVLDDELEVCQEGCLSVPGFYEDVERANHIRLKALNRNGQPYELEVRGLLAVCIQHEIDHLNGKLFVDYVSPLKRNRIRKKLEKIHREDAHGLNRPLQTGPV